MTGKLRAVCLLVFLGAFFLHLQQHVSVASGPNTDSGASTGRIAVAAVADDVNSDISPVAARAPYYLIFDKDGAFLKAVKNPFSGSARDSSSGVVDLVVKESCKTMIAGEFGYKMQSRLKANGITYYERKGSVKKALRAFTAKGE
jgi:predicted Fe-Mo cluster-binding NifX family protein